MINKTLVSIPEKVKMYERKSGTYIYHVTSTSYKKDKQYNIESRVCIGKKYNDEKMYPNENYFKYYNSEIEYLEEAPEFDVCVSIGSMAIFDIYLKKTGVESIISSLNLNNESLCKDLIYYYTMGFDTTSLYYKDFAYTHYCYSKVIYSKSQISKFLKNLPLDSTHDFLDKWNKSITDKDGIYIDYDGTNMNTSSSKSEIAEYGKAKVDEDLPQINLSYAINHKTGMPLFYELYPGSINDMAQTKTMVNKAVQYGYAEKDITFIIDRGMCSKENLDYMDEKGFKYIVMAKINIEIIKNSILANSNQIKNKYEQYIPEFDIYGLSLERDVFKDKKIRYIHIYYDSEKAEDEIRACHKKMAIYEATMNEAIENKLKVNSLGSYKKYFNIEKNNSDEVVSYTLNKVAIAQEIEMAGYFVIITKDKLDIKDVIREYRKRDIVEKTFRDIKSYLQLNKFRVSEDSSINSKVFLSFIASIIKTNLKNKLANYMKENNCESFKSVIKNLERIKAVKINGKYIRLYALTGQQKKMLAALEITEKEINSYLNVINNG